eukprot:gene31034-40371_t
MIVWPSFWLPSYSTGCYDDGIIVPLCQKTGWTALHRAAYNGHMTTVSLLLQQGADIQAKTNEGWTVLHEAAVNGHTAIVALILEQGADIGSMNNNGKRAVDLAKKEETKNLLQTWKPPSQDGAERQQYRENKASRKPSICTFHTANRSAITPESLSSATLSTSLPTGSGTAPASVWSKSTLAGLARFSNVYSLAIGFIILFIFYRLMGRERRRPLILNLPRPVRQVRK